LGTLVVVVVDLVETQLGLLAVERVLVEVDTIMVGLTVKMELQTVVAVAAAQVAEAVALGEAADLV
jgi:hypothetical protein